MPTSDDDVTINVFESVPIDITGQADSVHSISSATPILIDARGSLSVAADSTLSGGLTIAPTGSLFVNGAGTLTVTGTPIIMGAQLVASGGGTLRMPDLTTATLGASLSATRLEARDAGSVLALPALTMITVALSDSDPIPQVRAAAGGDVELPALKTVFGSRVQIQADGPGSMLDLASLTKLSADVIPPTAPGEIEVTNHATLNAPVLATLGSVNLTFDGTGTESLNQVATFAQGTLTLSGGSAILSGLTNADGSSFVASGGASLSVPNLTSYSGVGTFEASGAGSVLSFNALTMLGSTPNTDTAVTLQIQATAGADIEMPTLAKIAGQTVLLQADGENSVLNVSALAVFRNDGADAASQIEVTNGASFNDADLTTLNGVGITLDGTGSISLKQISTFTLGSISWASGTASLDSLVDADGSGFLVSGGAEITIPALNAYVATNPLSTPAVFKATDANSVLSFPSLATMSANGNNVSTPVLRLEVAAMAGGDIEFPALTSISHGPIELDTDGKNSVLNISALVTFTGSSTAGGALVQSSIQVTQGGTLEDPVLRTLNSVVVTLDGTGNASLAQISTNLLGGVQLLGGTVVLSGLTNGDGSQFEAMNGASLTVPAVTTYAGPIDQGAGFAAEGVNSVLSFPALRSVAAPGRSSNSFMTIAAQNGGSVSLPVLTTIGLGPVGLESDGPGSLLSVPSLGLFQGLEAQDDWGQSRIVQMNGGRIVASSLTRTTGVNIYGDLGGTLALSNTFGLEVDGGAETFVGGTLDDQSTLILQNEAVLNVLGSLSVAKFGLFETTPGTTIDISGDLTGTIQDVATFAPQGAVVFDGGTTSDQQPQNLEAMSADRGAGPAGFKTNFVYSLLKLTPGTSVRLVDKSRNTSGTTPEAVYVDDLTIPAGATLDLNGLHLYAHTWHVAGSVIGGAINQSRSGDFDHDGIADPAVFEPSTATFYIAGSQAGNESNQFGVGTLYGGRPINVSAAYEAVGVLDPAVFEPSTSTFYIHTTRGNQAIQFGIGTRYGGHPIPVPGNYEGDGIIDPAVFEPSTSTFYIARHNGPNVAIQFGIGTRYGGNPVPVPGNYEGDGQTDPAVFEPSTSTFYLARHNNVNEAIQFGIGTLYGGHPSPEPGNYQGDGQTDPAVFEPSTSTFYIAKHNAPNQAMQFGVGTLYGGHPVPVPLEYESDNQTDPAVFEPSTSTFFIARHNAPNEAVQFGIGTLYGGHPVPVPAAYEGGGQNDPAVFEPSTSTFYIARHNAPNEAIQFGIGTRYGGHPEPISSAVTSTSESGQSARSFGITVAAPTISSPASVASARMRLHDLALEHVHLTPLGSRHSTRLPAAKSRPKTIGSKMTKIHLE